MHRPAGSLYRRQNDVKGRQGLRQGKVTSPVMTRRGGSPALSGPRGRPASITPGQSPPDRSSARTATDPASPALPREPARTATGASSATPGGAAPPVIHAASASPSAGDEENPDPLHPLFTHRPCTPGTGPSTNRPSGLIVNSPPRCTATGPAEATGTSAATWPVSWRRTPEVQRHVVGAERGRLPPRVHRQRAGLEPADHQAAPGRPQVHRGVDHPDDRIAARITRTRLGDQQLVPHRRDAAPHRRPATPPARPTPRPRPPRPAR